MFEHPVRELVTKGKTHKIWCDRTKAAFGSWYEFFPRSTGGIDETGQAVHGTFATAAKELDRVAAMGFDVVYFPPIHPVGRVNRKGPNNTLVAAPEDCGSPWAIGADEGGHDAIAPELGTLEDFDALVERRARARPGGRARLRAAVRAGPPVGAQAPGVVHDQAGRHDRVRGEPAQEVPGHLPDQLRPRPAGPLPRGAPGDAALGRARGADLPGRQPAHQAAGLLAVADLEGQGGLPGRAVPVRGLHPPGPALRPGEARLHPVLHVLHVADRRSRS